MVSSPTGWASIAAKSTLKPQGNALTAIDRPTEISKWDPGFTERVMGWMRPLIKGYHRAEVRGLDSFPPGGALVVANHSGGLFAMDVPVFATGFYESSATNGRSTH